MKNEKGRIITAYILVVLLCCISADGAGKITTGKVLYRVGLASDKSKTVAVRQNGKNLELNLEGFGQSIVLKVSGGGVRTCRTILEHKSNQATIILSLPITNPNTPCQMTAGFVSINSQTYNISVSEEQVNKTSGSNIQLRKLVEKLFGKI